MNSLERWIFDIGLTLIGVTIALIVADVLLDGFTIEFWYYPVVIVITTVVLMIVRPVTNWAIQQWAPQAATLFGLVAAFLTLLVTDLISDAMDIEGFGDWIFATLLVWVAYVLTQLGLDAFLKSRAKDKAAEALNRPR